MSTPEEAAKQIFGKRAGFYTNSAVHTDEQVLSRVVELAQPQPVWHALDIATGTGHTAFALAPHVKRVVGVDITPEMLAEAEKLAIQKGITNVEFELADVHDLPFEDATFDLVTARRAPHHFSDISRAIDEIKRVLRAGGRLVIDDRSVPEDDFIDQTMNQLDWLHDESHVRQYRPSEWERMLTDAGFSIETVGPYTKHRPISSLTYGVSEHNVAEIHRILDSFSDEQRDAFDLREKEGELHLTHWYVMVAATA